MESPTYSCHILGVESPTFSRHMWGVESPTTFRHAWDVRVTRGFPSYLGCRVTCVFRHLWDVESPTLCCHIWEVELCLIVIRGTWSHHRLFPCVGRGVTYLSSYVGRIVTYVILTWLGRDFESFCVRFSVDQRRPVLAWILNRMFCGVFR